MIDWILLKFGYEKRHSNTFQSTIPEWNWNKMLEDDAELKVGDVLCVKMTRIILDRRLSEFSFLGAIVEDIQITKEKGRCVTFRLTSAL